MATTSKIPVKGQKAFFKNTYVGIVQNVEKLSEKYSRDITHLITIKTPSGTPVIGKRKGVNFSKETYNFR